MAVFKEGEALKLDHLLVGMQWKTPKAIILTAVPVKI